MNIWRWISECYFEVDTEHVVRYISTYISRHIL